MPSASSPASSPRSSAPSPNAARQRAASYAKRFAAKEACAKALGTGLARGVFWRDMGVVNLPGGKPTMQLTNGAAARLAEITPAGHVAFIHLTITDDFPLAQAFVVIEAIRDGAAIDPVRLMRLTLLWTHCDGLHCPEALSRYANHANRDREFHERGREKSKSRNPAVSARPSVLSSRR